MSNRIAIAYPKQARAAEALGAIKRLQADHAIDLDDAVALTKDEVGRVTVDGTTRHTGQGALGGWRLGAVLGTLVAAPVLGALFGAAAGAQTAIPPRAYWPTAGWRTADPAARGMDPALLAAAEQRARTDLPRLSALLVVRGGDIVAESCFNGQTSAAPIDVWSVTRSVTIMAVGIAIAEGRLRLDQTLGDLIPERIPAGADPRTARVTVEQLLTMTDGWAWDSRTDFMHLDDAPDWAARTLDLPMARDPGACYEYNSGGVHLLSVILQKVTGQTEVDYVQARIFDPLGIARPA